MHSHGYIYVSMTLNDASLLLAQAVASPYGLVLSASDPQKTRQMLYRARKRWVASSEFAELQVRLVAIGEGNMVICKTRVALPAQAGTVS